MTRYVEKKGYHEVPKTAYKARHPRDLYSTPRPVIDALLADSRPPEGFKVLEPCAGEGAIVRALMDRGYSVTAIEIDQGLAEKLAQTCHTVCHDFLMLSFDLPLMRQAAIRAAVTNPPFDQGLEFAEKILGLELEYVALLLPTAFMHSKARYDFNRRYPPTGLFPIRDRVKYDLTVKTHPPRDQSWFVWDRREPVMNIKPLVVNPKPLTQEVTNEASPSMAVRKLSSS